MLPLHQQNSTTSKRSNYHLSSRNTHGYHPYYSSSPVGVTANVHYVSSSSSSIASNASSLRYQSFAKNVEYNSSSSEDDQQNLSSLSTQTNPPTTPASCTSTNNTPQSAVSSPVLQFKSKIEPILNVTPVTGSSSSSVSNFKLDYSASCSASATTTSTSSSVGSTSANACSRSSSMASLSSFDIKSINSVTPSEYSSVPMSAGFMTPAAYSDLPDSPGEILPNAMHSRLITSSVNNSASNQRTFNFMKSTNMTTTINEISILTCDSNPKSNDITLIEKTVLASNSHNNTNVISNFGTSGYSTLVMNDDDNPNNQMNMSISEEVKQFEVNDSLNESRPNVSQLTFQDDPTPDIVAIRKLLNKQTQPTQPIVQQTLEQPRFMLLQQQQQIQQPNWGNFAFNKISSFTPPVKLAPVVQDPNELIKTSKRLIYEEEENRYTEDVEYYKDELQAKDLTCQDQDQDEDDKYSIASVPSDIVREHQPQNLDVSNFSAILNRSKNLCQDTSKLYESSPLINTNRFIFDLVKQQSINNSCDLTFNNTMTNMTSNTINTNNETVCMKKQDEDDEQILEDFIDEMLPYALGPNSNTVNQSSHVDESINEEDEEQLLKYQKIYENNLENHIPLSNQLAKIDEEDEEHEAHKLKEIKKRPIVQMNKTSQLRALKVMQTKTNNLNLANNNNKMIQTNTSSVKRQALSNSSSINSISQKLTHPLQQQQSKKATITPQITRTTVTKTIKK